MKKSLVALLSLVLVTGTAVAKEHESSCCKSIKKRLHSLNKKLNDIEQLELRLNKSAAKQISQKKIDKAGGTLTLTCPGDYCVTENITGTIVIGADSVCLDLCCHTLDADGAPNAIVADGYQGLKVFDGRIINSTDAAILIDNYSAVELFKLVMSNNSLDAIRESNSFDLSVHDVDFINDNSGERALLLDTCNNIVVKSCNASGFLSTIGAVIQLDGCHNALVEEVDVSFNIKTAAATVNEFTQGTAFVSVSESDGVDFILVKVNNNTFDNSVPVADQSHWRTAEAIFFTSSSTCNLNQCETCNNTDITGSLANVDTEDYMLLFLGCTSCTATKHQSSENRSMEDTVGILYFMAIAAFDSTGITLEGCNVNSNEVARLYVLSGVASLHYGISLSPYFASVPNRDFIVRNCQVAGNIVVDGGPGRTFPPLSGGGNLVGIEIDGSVTFPTLESRSTIEYCQVNDNVMISRAEAQGVAGIRIAAATDILVDHCSCNNNSGGKDALGIQLVGSPNNPCRNITVSNCMANNMSARDKAVGIDLFGVFDANLNKRNGCENCTVLNCQANRNTSSILGHGIALTDTIGCSVVGCQTDKNSHVGVFAGLISALVDPAPENFDCSIINCSAKENGTHGFQLDATTNDNFLLQDNVAMKNLGYGFLHSPAVLTSRYLGNYASKNVTGDYSIVGGIIQIFTLNASGVYAIDTGDATHFSSLINIRTIP